MKGSFLYIGPFQLPDRNAAAQRVLGIAKALRQLEYEVVFLDFDKDCNAFSGIPHDVCGFQTYSQPYPSSLKQWLKHALCPMYVQDVLKKHTEWKGVIAYNYPAVALRRLTFLCHSLKIKVLADCTEWYTPVFSNLHRMAVTFDSCLRMRWAQKKVDGIIAISAFLANYYQPYTKVITLPPLVDIEDEKWKIVESQKANDRISLYYVGSPGLGYGKDRIDVIIDALDKCHSSNQLVFHVVGITEEQFLQAFPNFQESVHKLSNQNSLIFHGRLTHQEAIALLKKADYSIFLREKNRMTLAGFPTKFAESITCGVPVITNDTSDLKRYLSDDKGGILVELDIKQISNTFSSLSKKHHDHYVDKETFDYKRYTKQIRNFVEQVIVD